MLADHYYSITEPRGCLARSALQEMQQRQRLGTFIILLNRDQFDNDKEILFIIFRISVARYFTTLSLPVSPSEAWRCSIVV